MNSEQQNALNAIKENLSIFITGSPGTGKSYTLKEIIKYLKTIRKNIAITSSTGCSAVLINGQTIHSFLGLGANNASVDKVIANLKSQKQKYNQIKDLDTLIIDEISMIDNTTFEKISTIFQKIKENTELFGGIQLIIVGDFCQLSPVKGDYCFLSEIWKKLNLKTIHLTQLIRQKDDEEFQKILQSVRFGKCPIKIFKILQKLEETKFDSNIMPTKLYSLNEHVDNINKYNIQKLYKKNTKKPFEEGKIIHITPTIINKLNEELTLESLTLQNIQDYDINNDIFRYYAYSTDKSIKVKEYEIDLIKGAYIMVTRNINFESGLINGTLGTILSLSSTYVSIVDSNGINHNIYYYKDTNENNNTYTKFMPIKLAYALSIHKSQGTTLNAIEVDGSNFIFAPGQLYTALSRAKNLNSIKLVNLDKYSFICNKDVKEFYETIE